MDHDDIVPVYLEKFKGGRVVFYRGGDSKNNNNTVSQVFVGLVFAILYSLYVSVIIADRVWEGQLSYAAIIFFFVLSRVLIFTYHLSRGVEGATDAICTCDHVQKHNDAWRDDVAKCDHGDGFIEAGTIVNWGIEYASGVQKLHCGDSLAGESDADKIVDDLLQVQWDCGYRKVYSRINGEWNLLRVFDMGPTGLKSYVLLCDECKDSLTGFSFRCTNKECSDNRSQVYDLCYIHYNDNTHHHDDESHQFRVFPLHNNDNEWPQKGDAAMSVRSTARRYRLIGLFPQAHVVSYDGKDKGKITEIVHKGGHSKRRNSNFWNCTAEFKIKGSDEIRYGDIGAHGEMTMTATVAGIGGYIYADHFPSIGDELILDIVRHIHRGRKVFTLPTGDQYFISKEHQYKIISLTDTDLQHVNFSDMWMNCEDIEFVNLLHNKLQSLCYSLQNHSSTLQIANLSYNNFDNIPDTLFCLYKLRNLNMMHNSVSVVPQSISQLGSLTHLYLSHNDIFSVPDSLSACKNLNTLCLHHNRLSHIPNSIQRLHYLHTLELHNNYLQNFEVSNRDDFKALQHLSLHYNRLQVLPKGFQQLLNRLESCTLHGNPFPEPEFYKELLHLNNENQTCAQNKGIGKKCVQLAPRRSFRVLVVGGCGSGKTSIIRVLCKDKYVTPVESCEHNHTIGIEQHVHHFESCGSIYELSVWDFAGEDSYSMMNYMFLSEGTLVWLVINLAQFEANSPGSCQMMIGVWLRGIVARVKNPLVWIIGTHADKCSESEVLKKKNEIYSFVAEEHKYFKSVMEQGSVMHSEVTSSIANDEILFKLASVKVFTVSNTFERFGYDTLYNEIKNIPSSGISKWHTIVPPEWLHAYTFLKETSAEILIEDYSKLMDQLCEKEVASGKSDAEDILKYFHESGDILIICVDWESECKANKVFLDVMRLINALKQIFRHDLHKTIEEKLSISRNYDKLSQEGILTLVCEHGIISEDILMKLWSPLSINKNDMKLLIDLLQQFKMAYRVNRGKEVCYLFPFLLKPCILSDKPQANFKHIKICCRFGFIPCGLFEKLLCCALPCLSPQEYKIHRDKLEGITYSNGDRKLKLLILCKRSRERNYDGTIDIHVEEVNNNMPVEYSALWQLAINVIRKLKKVISEWSTLRVCMDVPCPLCSEEEKHIFPLEIPSFSTTIADVKCDHGELNVESVIPSIRLFLDDFTNEEVIELACKSQCGIMTSPRVVAAIAEVISSDWKSFARKLNLVDERIIKEIEYDQQQTCKDMCCQMLLAWAKSRLAQTTIGDLAKAINKCSCCQSEWIDALRAGLKVSYEDDEY